MLQLFDMRETGGLELATTITLVLQANQLTKSPQDGIYPHKKNLLRILIPVATYNISKTLPGKLL